jgi:glycogen operon protein
MLLAGDEAGHTQQGNNNGYCQDNEISWLDWNLDPRRESLLEFTRSLIRLFHEHPVLRRRHFFQGRQIQGTDAKELAWFRADGQEMVAENWENSDNRCFGLSLAGDAVYETDSRGNRIVDDTLLILLNAHYEPVPFHLPELKPKEPWELILDTREGMIRLRPRFRRGAIYHLEARSLALFRLADSEKTSHTPRMPSRRKTKV